MDYFPAFLNLNDQACLVVGGGNVAARKINLLVRTGAKITVIAKTISNEVRLLADNHQLDIKEQEFTAADFSQFRLIVSATNNPDCNQLVAKTAHTQNILVNVVDCPELSSFIFPAIVDRSPVVIALSSGGAAPVLARLLRAKLETVIPPAYGQLAKLAQQFRNKAKQAITLPEQRKVFWENVFQGNIAEQIFTGNYAKAEQLINHALDNNPNNPGGGEVYLIGAGPGAADLLTFRALRLLQQADVVVYDRLVSPEILDLARRDADKVYVGKQRDQHTLLQDSINTLLADLAKKGKRVARLKGGDPFIFGRGGEEIETLLEQKIPFQVVPGITAASGCASYAGIPLTHRDYAQSCIFITGHLRDNTVNLNWTQLTLPNQTVVIYMGSHGLSHICQALITHGAPDDTPIALIEQGTTANQKVHIGTLATFTEQVAARPIKAPTLIIIGKVVNLHKKLHWFGNNPSD
jgi:uroporphyrin-III C-methyltransferase / precorrin-2 dehydrogenase / sirohydrochlorin ferrochelatase